MSIYSGQNSESTKHLGREFVVLGKSGVVTGEWMNIPVTFLSEVTVYVPFMLCLKLKRPFRSHAFIA